MVEVIQPYIRAVPYPVTVPHTQRTSPRIEIHSIVRNVHGNEISVTVMGEMKIAGGEFVLARELKLKTIQVLVLTCEPPAYDGLGYIAQKHIFEKGQFDNSASIDVFDDASTWQSPGVGPEDGSIWLDFIAQGE